MATKPTRSRRSTNFYQNDDQLCTEEFEEIDWHQYVQDEICPILKNELPQCIGRYDSCISCMGNGTLGKID